MLVLRAAPVPDADRLRRAVLQASWDRGRWVARRRLAWRWLLWVTGRYVVPALAVSGLATGLWWATAKDIGDPLQALTRWYGPTTAPAPAPATAATKKPPTPEPTQAKEETPGDISDPEADAYSPEGELLPRPLPLKFEPRCGNAAAAHRTAPSVTLPASTEPDITPSLKPENWLHSKEP